MRWAGSLSVSFARARADRNPTLGVNTIVGERWDLTVEGGLGDRVSALLNLCYRF
jgi:hypothetical protein